MAATAAVEAAAATGSQPEWVQQAAAEVAAAGGSQQRLLTAHAHLLAVGGLRLVQGHLPQAGVLLASLALAHIGTHEAALLRAGAGAEQQQHVLSAANASPPRVA